MVCYATGQGWANTTSQFSLYWSPWRKSVVMLSWGQAYKFCANSAVMSHHRLLKQLVFGWLNNLRPPSCPRSSFNNAMLSSCRNYCVNGQTKKKWQCRLETCPMEVPDGLQSHPSPTKPQESAFLIEFLSWRRPCKRTRIYGSGCCKGQPANSSFETIAAITTW